MLPHRRSVFAATLLVATTLVAQTQSPDEVMLRKIYSEALVHGEAFEKVNPRELHLGAAALASLLWLVDTQGL